MTLKAAMIHMINLHSCHMWLPGKQKAMRIMEEPNKEQANIMQALGWKIAGGGALQKI